MDQQLADDVLCSNGAREARRYPRLADPRMTWDELISSARAWLGP